MSSVPFSLPVRGDYGILTEGRLREGRDLYYSILTAGYTRIPRKQCQNGDLRVTG